jgi:hypothetical protein
VLTGHAGDGKELGTRFCFSYGLQVRGVGGVRGGAREVDVDAG